MTEGSRDEQVGSNEPLSSEGWKSGRPPTGSHESTSSWPSWLEIRGGLYTDTLFLLAFAAAAVGLPLLYLDQPLHFDEGIFLAIGNRLSTGETLYADVADHKPPGIFILAASIYELSGSQVLVARLLTYGVTALSGLLVVRLGRELYSRRAAQAAGVLFVVLFYLPHFDGSHFLTEPYAVLAILVSAVLLGYDTPISNALVGVALTVGVLFNQTVFLFGATILLFQFLRVRYPENRTREAVVGSTKRILTIGFGFLTASGAALLVLASRGLLENTIHYSIVLPLTRYSTPFDLWGHALAFGMLLPVWLLVGGTLVLTGISFARGETVGDRFLFVALWAGVMSVPGATSFAGTHKFLFAFPAIALLSVAGLVKLRRMIGRNRDELDSLRGGLASRSTVVTAVLIVVVLATAVVSGAGNAYYASHVLDRDLSGERQAFETAVDGTEGPVYGYNVMAGLYVHTDTEPGTTYLGTIYSDGLARDKIADLERNRVQYVLVTNLYVSNGRITSKGYWSDHKSVMVGYLNENYEPVRETDGYVVFRRVSDSDTARSNPTPARS